MLLTNLSVATGVSYLSFQAGSSSNSSDEGGLSLRTITLGMGLWTLVSVTIALFAACLLAIKLSLLQEIFYWGPSLAWSFGPPTFPCWSGLAPPPSVP